MRIGSDSYDRGGLSPGSVSRGYVGKNPFVYPFFEWLFRFTVRGDGLPVRRIGGECAGFA
jgi:hypothetical protein